MASPTGVVVTLDGEIVPPDRPLIYADDLGAVRGDGVFETLLVRDGRACLVEAHLQRLAHSAKLMELPQPELPKWRRCIQVAARQWTSVTAEEGIMRLAYGRGRASAVRQAAVGTSLSRRVPAAPTAYVTVDPLADRVVAARRDGVAAVTLSRGLAATGADAMPWLLLGAKTSSYAVNFAASRQAARLGADEGVFVSTDGYVLEGTSSTVVIAGNESGSGGNFCLLTPPPWYPILRGTTQQAIFDIARANGYDCDYRALRPTDLLAAQGIWLVSSVTLAARVHTLDGHRLPPTPIAAEFAELVDAAVVSDR